MVDHDKPLIWLHGEVKTPPLSRAARLETGILLRRLQRGEAVSLPRSRPMPSMGKRCHELRIIDEGATWRLIYRVDQDAIIIVEVFAKKTSATPRPVIESSKTRLRKYDQAVKENQG
ncbi:MAG: type II toxin-antitoxin system RelE/ParE family toxin [Actinobacteria bacterium]|nr:type II toxin-antitoxin system RelE/ParE family toxin [Actinomycetota bacterium]